MSQAATIRWGYIRGPREDLFWFVALPFVGLLLAWLCQQYLTFVALASINLWITVPHHFGTWCRAYGLKEDWERFRWPLILGPCVIFAVLAAGLAWLPLTVFLVTLIWDHQHSLMQQHGLARIYDFKAQSGSPRTGRFDLWLHILLFGNMLLTAPLWTEIWVHQLFVWQLPISAGWVKLVHSVSYLVTGGYLLFYVGFVLREFRSGYALNPLKYLFLLSSYSLWYTASWNTHSALVFGIAHRIMHGLQYLVIVYWYLERKQTKSGDRPWMLPRLNGWSFALAGVVYAVLFQTLLWRPWQEFGFGLWTAQTPPAPLSMEQSMSVQNRTYDLYAATVINSTALLHYYFDSFIWKVRDEKTQEGL